MKKIISTLLCAVIAFSGVITANAAQTEKEIEKHKGIEFLEESFVLPNNTMRLISTVENVEMKGISNYYTLVKNKQIENNESRYVNLSFNENINEYKDIEIEPGKYYIQGTKTFDSTKTGGIYKKVKIKLSEFKDCFDDQGYYYEDYFYKKHFNYKFNKYEVKGYDASSFAVYSGAYLKRTLPDVNGEVEVYVHTNVGDRVYALIPCSLSDGKVQSAGLMTESLNKLTFGNVDCNDYLDVKDVTALQLYISGLQELDELGLFHADTNCDGIYDVKDVTHLQLGIVSLKG